MERLDWEHIHKELPGKGGRSHLATPTTDHPRRLLPFRSSRCLGGRNGREGRHGALTLRLSWIGCGPRPTYLRTLSNLGLRRHPSGGDHAGGVRLEYSHLVVVCVSCPPFFKAG